MSEYVQFDGQDKTAFAKLGDFTIRGEIRGEVATFKGVMEVVIVRVAHDGDDQFRVGKIFHGGELVWGLQIARAEFLGKVMAVEPNSSMKITVAKPPVSSGHRRQCDRNQTNKTRETFR